MAPGEDELQDDERQDSDYDGAWKETLKSHLPEVMQRCFPTIANLIDWRTEPEWLDTEISQIVGQSRRRNKEVDVLFKVRLINGRNQRILCHLEIQSAFEADFAFRIDLYNCGLKWLFREDVLTLVILADLNPDWRPNSHHFELGDFSSDRRFPVCKILDSLANDWAEETSLVAHVARAQISALRTAGDPEGRFSAKTQLVRNLYTLGYTSDRIREVFRLIDWMMHLTSDLEQRFKAEMVAYETELQMPYVTSIERLAKEEGREEGRISMLLLILNRICGQLPEDVEQSVSQLDSEKRQNLAADMVTFDSVGDLKDWLKNVAN